jgi:hypothetical protein
MAPALILSVGAIFSLRCACPADLEGTLARGLWPKNFLRFKKSKISCEGGLARLADLSDHACGENIPSNINFGVGLFWTESELLILLRESGNNAPD